MHQACTTNTDCSVVLLTKPLSERHACHACFIVDGTTQLLRKMGAGESGDGDHKGVDEANEAVKEELQVREESITPIDGTTAANCTK